MQNYIINNFPTDYFYVMFMHVDKNNIQINGVNLEIPLVLCLIDDGPELVVVDPELGVVGPEFVAVDPESGVEGPELVVFGPGLCVVGPTQSASAPR